jgi:hypothetical protein
MIEYFKNLEEKKITSLIQWKIIPFFVIESFLYIILISLMISFSIKIIHEEKIHENNVTSVFFQLISQIYIKNNISKDDINIKSYQQTFSQYYNSKYLIGLVIFVCFIHSIITPYLLNKMENNLQKHIWKNFLINEEIHKKLAYSVTRCNYELNSLFCKRLFYNILVFILFDYRTIPLAILLTLIVFQKEKMFINQQFISFLTLTILYLLSNNFIFLFFSKIEILNNGFLQEYIDKFLTLKEKTNLLINELENKKIKKYEVKSPINYELKNFFFKYNYFTLLKPINMKIPYENTIFLNLNNKKYLISKHLASNIFINNVNSNEVQNLPVIYIDHMFPMNSSLSVIEFLSYWSDEDHIEKYLPDNIEEYIFPALLKEKIQMITFRDRRNILLLLTYILMKKYSNSLFVIEDFLNIPSLKVTKIVFSDQNPKLFKEEDILLTLTNKKLEIINKAK